MKCKFHLFLLIFYLLYIIVVLRQNVKDIFSIMDISIWNERTRYDYLRLLPHILFCSTL